jgi:hypothetical protein
VVEDGDDVQPSFIDVERESLSPAFYDRHDFSPESSPADA